MVAQFPAFVSEIEMWQEKLELWLGRVSLPRLQSRARMTLIFSFSWRSVASHCNVMNICDFSHVLTQLFAPWSNGSAKHVEFVSRKCPSLHLHTDVLVSPLRQRSKNTNRCTQTSKNMPRWCSAAFLSDEVRVKDWPSMMSHRRLRIARLFVCVLSCNVMSS